jgi:DNA-binding response OmpR family regulator
MCADMTTESEIRTGVLLVEDEVKVARFISQGLQEEGYAVDVAMTFAEAESRLRGVQAPALLILDWMLPDGDGLLLAKRCRAQGHMMPILMLTARDAIEERVDALDAGVDDYLVKPFAFAELLARMRALLRRSRGRVGVVRVCDLEIDLMSRTARRAGVAVPLTAKEFAVLSYLASHQGRAVSRAELLEQVWASSQDTTGIANVVDAQIMKLRDKLEGKGTPPILHTVRRIGYCLGVSPESSERPGPSSG